MIWKWRLLNHKDTPLSCQSAHYRNMQGTMSLLLNHLSDDETKKNIIECVLHSNFLFFGQCAVFYIHKLKQLLRCQHSNCWLIDDLILVLFLLFREHCIRNEELHFESQLICISICIVFSQQTIETVYDFISIE